MSKLKKDELIKKVRSLMLGMPDVLRVEVLEQRRAAIVAISELCKKTPIYRKTEATREDFYRPLRKVGYEKALLMAWVHFLDRFSKAPSQAHMEGVVALCFPVLGDILKAKRA